MIKATKLKDLPVQKHKKGDFLIGFNKFGRRRLKLWPITKGG